MRHAFFNRTQCCLSICFMLLLSACTSTSDTPAQSMAGSASSAPEVSSEELTDDGRIAEAAVDPDPIVCERIAEIGTKIQKKTCMRKSQWDRQKSASSEMTSEWQRKGNLVGNPSGE